MSCSRVFSRTFLAALLAVGAAGCAADDEPPLRDAGEDDQRRTVQARVEALGLETQTTDRLTTYFAPEDRARADQLSRLVAAAAAHVEHELGVSFDLRMAALPNGRWFTEDTDSDAGPTIPWASVEERWIVVPASGERIPGGGFPRAVDFIALHEFGHIASEQYFSAGRTTGYGDVPWFWELLATYVGYTFVAESQPAWADALRSAWRDILGASTPGEVSLDWSFMRTLPPEERGPTEAWHQILLNLRAAEIHDDRGVEFLRVLKQSLDWDQSDTWTNETLLPKLEQSAPGFLFWAKAVSSLR